jgi:hypothetical protein
LRLHSRIRHRANQEVQEHRSVQSHAMELLAKLRVAKIEHPGSLAAYDVKALHPRAMDPDRPEDSQFLQHSHPGGLKEETRAHRTALGRTLEKRHAVTLSLQESRRSRPGGAAADDGDPQSFLHAPDGPSPIQTGKVEFHPREDPDLIFPGTRTDFPRHSKNFRLF